MVCDTSDQIGWLLSKGTAVIIGAGPAGLTAAYELLCRTDILPIVIEKSDYMGGISRTVNYKNNRIDIGGHRFFSKSDRVMDWWLQHLPMEESTGAAQSITYQGKTREVSPGEQVRDPKRDDELMLVRRRKSRIYYLRQFFDYPIQLNMDTLRKLGPLRTVRIGLSYLRSAFFPPRQAVNLEQFFIKRFGRELYRTFFQSYTEKVWGVPCREIGAEWGEQRIKGLSITKTVLHFLKTALGRKADVRQKGTETSLIEQFLYPKYGPGQMWETVARKIREKGGLIHCGIDVRGVRVEQNRIVAVNGVDGTGALREFTGDYFFSTMPVKELVRSMDATGAEVPDSVREISDGLIYRDFVTVGLLVQRLKVGEAGHIDDNWIYIQEPDVLAGRLQIFNNWSPHMVADSRNVWLGVEYFCNENDDLWNKPDAEMKKLAAEELHSIGIIDQKDVLDATVIRMPKTYPAYFGTYSRFPELRRYLDGFENLFLVGRNGMHKYNNQDHSMLTAMVAVDQIACGSVDKEAIWEVNTEMEYHEGRS
jgi:protoporphyrinogen oxidase